MFRRNKKETKSKTEENKENIYKKLKSIRKNWDKAKQANTTKWQINKTNCMLLLDTSETKKKNFRQNVFVCILCVTSDLFL